MWQFERLTTSRVARCSAMRSAGLAGAADASFSLVHGDLDAEPDYFFFVSLITTRSSCVAHALALVRLGRTVGADLRRHLADLLLVDALDQNLGLHRGLDLDALRHRVHDRMRETERQVDLVAGGLRAEADADQRQLLLEARGDALDHVRDQRAQRAVHRRAPLRWRPCRRACRRPSRSTRCCRRCASACRAVP